MPCELCSWKGPKYYLKAHSRTAHVGHDCNLCDFKGLNDADLKMHKEQEHSKPTDSGLAKRLNLSPELYQKFVDTINNATNK